METKDLVVIGKNNTPITTSLKVAAKFGKAHYNVIRDIETLDCSTEFNALNFEGDTYVDGKGESRKMFNMTRDGFTFLVMGYRGKTAAKFKEQYINAFNKMEAFIKSQSQPKELTRLEILQMAIDSEKRALAAEARVEEQAQQIEEQWDVIDVLGPKAEGYDHLVETGSTFSLTNGLKAAGIGNTRKGIQWLRWSKMLTTQNIPTPWPINNKWMVIKKVWANGDYREQARLTTEGVIYLQNRRLKGTVDLEKAWRNR